MTNAGAPRFVCHGCGAVVDAARALPFACPNARPGDDVDHVLVAAAELEGDVDAARRTRSCATGVG